MTAYLLAQGWDNTAGFAALPTTYDPRTPTVTPGRAERAGDGLVYADGHWDAPWIFDTLPDSEYAAMLTAAGLDADTESAKVTVYMPHRDQSWAAWNAIIHYPEGEHRAGRWEPVTFRLRLVKQVAYTP